MRYRGLKTAALMCVVLALGAIGAEAASVNSFINYAPNENNAQDKNAEYLIVDANNDGILDEGDVIVGAMDIARLNGTGSNLGGLTSNAQWTAVFALEVADILNVNSSSGLADIVFTAWDGLDNYIAGLDTDLSTTGTQTPDAPTSGTWVAGTVARFWTNSDTSDRADFSTNFGGGTANPYDNVGTAATGKYYWDLGFDDMDKASHVVDVNGTEVVVSTDGQGWVVRQGGLDVGSLTGVGGLFDLGTGWFSVNVLQNEGANYSVISRSLSSSLAGILGATTGADSYIIGSSTVGPTGTGTDSVYNAGFEASSDTKFSYFAVPLPMGVWPALALLASFGLVRMRRRSRPV